MFTYLLKMHYKFGYGIDNQLILKICCNKHFLKIEIVFSFYSKINLKKKKKSILAMTIECQMTAVIYFKRLPQKEEAVVK